MVRIYSRPPGDPQESPGKRRRPLLFPIITFTTHDRNSRLQATEINRERRFSENQKDPDRPSGPSLQLTVLRSIIGANCEGQY